MLIEGKDKGVFKLTRRELYVHGINGTTWFLCVFKPKGIGLATGVYQSHTGVKTIKPSQRVEME